MKRNLALIAISLCSAGCQPNIRYDWELVERRSEPTGRESYTVTLTAPETTRVGKASTIAVSGKVEHQSERNVWNVYKRLEARDFGKPKVEYVIDPERRRDDRYPQASNSISPSAISGIPREPTGLVIEPFDIDPRSGLRVRWTLAAAGDFSYAATGFAPILAGGAFRFEISPADARSVIDLPVSSFTLSIDLEGVPDSPLLSIRRPAPIVVDRATFTGAQ